MSATRSVAMVTLGCARNEVDSEELAGRLAANGWSLIDDASQADVALVNTCGFVEQAKKDSIDALLEAADGKESGRTQAVVAVGCLAERYGADLASELPEADAVLGFDSYADLSTHLQGILDGEKPQSHVPRDRRTLLPLAPAARQEAHDGVALPGHQQGHQQADKPEVSAPTEAWSVDGIVPDGTPQSGPPVVRARLDGRPWAPLKIASGCDRRCSFCAIPMFRGSFISRRPHEILAEARWLAERGVKEIFLVSENTTSYGKDLGDLRLLDALLPELAEIEGIERIRVSYLQPAEIRPDLLQVLAETPKVVPYYDVSFQHASGPVLRRMRRFGDKSAFLGLVDQIRSTSPQAGIRCNVIVGFPGETEADVDELADFLAGARLDVVGVFGYSDEDGTEAENLDGKLDPDTIAARVARITDLVELLTAERAADRVGEQVSVLVEEIEDDEEADGVRVVGRAEQQGPDVDGVTIMEWTGEPPAIGTIVTAEVVGTEGVDLLAVPVLDAARGRDAAEPVNAGEPAGVAP